MIELAPVRLMNTLTRSVEELRPLSGHQVRLYCCGPTVYNYQHIGNLRTYIFEDLLTRMLRYGGYTVTHVMNITDVGHLVSDADEGEDKMLVAARREGRSSLDIARYYTDIFFNHCADLNIRRPDVVCNATDHIPQMIELIQRLEQEGFAYVAAGNVYFDVSRYSEYGKLAQLDLEQLRSGARIEVDVNKRHPLDFALWFTRSKFENQELQWDSPWGRGYPGWHIECSAMSMHYLGESFDIHCGGIDHIPVHHTNEIAQSEAATHKPLASIWMHGGFLVADAGKMSKSSGEFLTLDRVTERGIDPISFRLLCLGTTYRSELSWSWQALEGAANALAKVKHRVLQLKEGGADAGFVALSPRGRELREQFREEIFNDLGAPKALKVFYETLNDTTLARNEQLGLLLEMDQVLGLGLDSWKEESIPEAITALAVQRQEARREKRFADADAFRDQILAQGYLLEESKEGFRIRKK